MSTERDATNHFIERWQGVTASELSTSQGFVIALCDLLGGPREARACGRKAGD